MNGPLRLQLSCFAIVHLEDKNEISEGIAMRLMNSPDRVSYRLAREKVEREMREILAADLAAEKALVMEQARRRAGYEA